jgi:hypothetical protein
MFPMRTTRLRPLAVVFSCAAIVWGGCATEGKQQGADAVNADARVQQDFQQRVKKYQSVRKQTAKQGPALKETSDPAKIKTAQDSLAANIRAARSDARPGDIFTPEIRALFRRLMYPELKGADGAATKELIKEDEPVGVRLEVNASYPDDEPMPTVPPNVLAALPRLPEGLEYRIVKKDLILRDVDANLIIDFIPNAIR